MCIECSIAQRMQRARERMIRMERTRDDLAKIERSRRSALRVLRLPCLCCRMACAAGRHESGHAHRCPPHLRPHSSSISSTGSRQTCCMRVTRARATRASTGWLASVSARCKAARVCLRGSRARSLGMPARGLRTGGAAQPALGRAQSMQSTHARAIQEGQEGMARAKGMLGSAHHPS